MCKWKCFYQVIKYSLAKLKKKEILQFMSFSMPSRYGWTIYKIFCFHHVQFSLQLFHNLLNQFSGKCWDFEMTKLQSFPCSDGIGLTLYLFWKSGHVHIFFARPISSCVLNHLMFKISSFYESLVTLWATKNWRLCKLKNLIQICCRW